MLQACSLGTCMNAAYTLPTRALQHKSHPFLWGCTTGSLGRGAYRQLRPVVASINAAKSYTHHPSLSGIWTHTHQVSCRQAPNTAAQDVDLRGATIGQCCAVSCNGPPSADLSWKNHDTVA